MIEAIVVAVLILPLIVLIIRYHPREMGLVSDGILKKGRSSPASATAPLQVRDRAWAAVDWTLLKAARTNRFWLLCLSTFSLWGLMQHIMVAHHVAFAVDLGYSEAYASSVLSLFGILFACGALAGFISDRIGRELTMTVGTICGMSGIFVLMLIRDTSHPWMLYCYAIALGFGFGMTTPAIAASVTDIFQGPKVGATIGSIWLSFSIGGSIGPWLGGWIFEVTRSYMVAFIVAMVFYGLACAALWWAAPRKVRLVAGHSRLERGEELGR